ncbi:MAG: tetratricopeptide repeat protein [Acidobacteria bacterium]|nr:tetratricopeptide repeat protein [Acidobacteriota bacterium]
MTKEQVVTITGVLATASITAVGFAIGGNIGAAVMGGIGINLWSNIIQSGAVKLKDRWLTSADGILNHDIQQALTRAFIKALTSLETRYFKLDEANALPKEKKQAIKEFFHELKDQSQAIFLPSIETAINEKEVKDYLYGNPETVQDALWQRIEATKLLYTYYGEHFQIFLRENCLAEVVFWFGEELKTDNKESNKAWRAFQRMLLEGIQEDVKAVRASQDVIQRDLQTLNVIREQLDHIKDTIDYRLPNEPFQDAFIKAIKEIQIVLYDVKTKVDVVDATTQRSEVKIDTIIAVLGAKPKAEIPKIPDDIQVLFDAGNDLRDAGKYEDARATFQKALETADSQGHMLAAATAKYYLAIILHEWDKKSPAAKNLLRECLQDVRAIDSEKHIAKALHYLGVIELHEGNLDQAKAYFSQTLELDKKNDDKRDIANTLHMLGWLEDHHGHSTEALEFYDQALTYLLGIYQEGNAKTVKEAAHSIAGEYQHKGLIYENLGNVEEAESNYMRALEWHRKSAFKPDVGKILYLLARLKYREAEYDKGTEFLDEATAIYNEIGDYSWCARCLHLKGQVHFTLRQTDKATAIFESALNAVEKSGDYKEQESYLNTLGDVYLKARKLEQAKEYFERARDLSVREEFLDGYAASVENLSKIAHIKKDDEERNRLLLDGIQTLEKFLLTVQAKPKRAFIIGQIGFFYEGMENFDQALIYYQKAEKAYQSLSDICGRANALASIARIKGLLGRADEEVDTYRELRKLLDGSPYYDLIAGTALNLGVLEMRMGNLDEARRLFQEAELLCRKYNLPHLTTLQDNVKTLDQKTKARKPPELNFRQLVEELFEWVDWFPEAKDSILRLWMDERAATLFSNYRNLVGIKFMVCQDDVDTFLRISDILHPYADLCLQIVSSKYPPARIDVIPFPMDKEIFFDCAIPRKEKIAEGVYTTSFLRGSFASRYALTSGTRVHSKITGNEGVTITGLSPGLPPQAHQLILSSSAADLIRRKIFFLPGERYRADDKLLADLDHSKQLGLIPIYFASLPDSEGAEVLTTAMIDLPVLSTEVAEQQRRQVRKVKHSLAQLVVTAKESAQAALSNFVFEVEELCDSCESEQAIQIQVYILHFPSGHELCSAQTYYESRKSHQAGWQR